MDSNNTTRSKNRRSKNGCFFCCFRPNYDINYYDPFVTKPLQKCKTMDQLPTIFSSALKSCGESNENGFMKNKSSNYGFLRQALKDTLNETSWGKKINNLRRKRNKDDNLSLKSVTNNIEGEVDKCSNTENKTTHQANINSSSSCMCSSPSLTIQSSLKSSTTTTTSLPGTKAWKPSSEVVNRIVMPKEKQVDEGYYGCNMSMLFLPLISLLTLILWGKICAIVCTSIGFFLVTPNRRKQEDLCGDTEFDSVHHRKKIIMEGFLERKRCHSKG